jgi:hypothetical protein
VIFKWHFDSRVMIASYLLTINAIKMATAALAAVE